MNEPMRSIEPDVPRQQIDRETAARQAEMTTQYDPLFQKLYLICSSALVIFSIAIVIIRWTATCNMPLRYWLLVNAVTSLIYMNLNAFAFTNFAHRFVTIRVINAFRVFFILLWVFGQFYVFSASPKTCDAVLWGSCLALIILEYIRISFPVLLILTIFWWYPLLERFLENSQHPGATPEEISGLPIKKFGKEESCSICLSAASMDEEARVIPCGHLFHAKCLDSWLQVKSLCPLCRASVFKGNEKELV
ncbi:hypothetical protein MHBO_003642 [Bonamia ostreae]|uniref:RING-type domain-containing protein n=1 Tax=Bonamia ostreae TaxID=126728 RepID=A0ABV2AR22_9EUKA